MIFFGRRILQRKQQVDRNRDRLCRLIPDFQRALGAAEFFDPTVKSTG
jgi:hypothetical protein